VEVEPLESGPTQQFRRSRWLIFSKCSHHLSALISRLGMSSKREPRGNVHTCAALRAALSSILAGRFAGFD
jgi:hypothetical protein